MEKEKTSTVVIFFINGINALLGWNAVLAAFDFFAKSFTGYNVYSFLPVPLFAGYLIVGVCYHYISNHFKYVNLIITGNLIVNVSLLAILLVSILFEQQLIGFILLLACSFFMGIGANTSQLTFFAMINYLSQDVVSKFTVGTAVSGLLITVIRAVITAIFGSDDESTTPTIIYFVIAVIINTINIFMNIFFCRSPVYKHKIDHFLLHHDKQKQGSGQGQGVAILDGLKQKEQQKEGSVTDVSEPVGEKYLEEEKRIEDQTYFLTMYETCMKISPYPFIIMFTFVITFTMYPGPTFIKEFSEIGGVWTVIIYNIAYNIGDTLGKYLADFNGAFNAKSLLFAFFLRLYFFFPITFMATGADTDDSLTNNYFFPFFNCFLFAVTNGFNINASFIMAFRVCPLAYKKYAGVLCGLMLQVGIMLGTIVQIPYAYIIGIN